MRGRFPIIVWLVVAGVVLSPPAWADFQAGLDAYNSGDYTAALKEWRPLAEQGDAEAQVALGVMYYEGQGVLKDDKEAAKWWRKAAEQGDAGAQARLGFSYLMSDSYLMGSFEGTGVPQDHVEAEKWARISAKQGFAGAYVLFTLINLSDEPDPELRKEKLKKALAYCMVADALDDSRKIDEILALLTELTTADQIAEAKELASGCAEQDYKGCEF